MTKIFLWLAIGLAISGLLSFKLLQSFNLLALINSQGIAILVIALIQLVLVIWLSLNLDTIPSPKIKLYYIGFAIFNGFSLPMIFQFFTQNYILSTFYILSGMFLIVGAMGYFLKKDFGKIYLLMSLAIAGIFLDVLVNVFWRNDHYQLFTSAIAIVVFVGILAYDYERINKEYLSESTDNEINGAVKGAFSVYLNLYYLFIIIVMAANKKDKRKSA